MFGIIGVLRDGLILSALVSLFVLISLRINPRLFLQDYPKDIQGAVPPKTPRGRLLSTIISIPFLVALLAVPLLSTWVLKLHTGGQVSFAALFLNAFGVAFVFNLVDLLLIDWLLTCTLTPKFVVIPGTEGMAGYKDYAFHVRGFLIGTLVSAAIGLIIAALVYFL